MAISREEIEHLAELSRIQLTEAEINEYPGQLSAVLDYISHLQQAATQSLDSTVQPIAIKNSWRNDQVKDWPRDEVALALEQGDLEDGHVKVKRVL